MLCLYRQGDTIYKYLADRNCTCSDGAILGLENFAAHHASSLCHNNEESKNVLQFNVCLC